MARDRQKSGVEELTWVWSPDSNSVRCSQVDVSQLFWGDNGGSRARNHEVVGIGRPASCAAPCWGGKIKGSQLRWPTLDYNSVLPTKTNN